MRIRRAQWAALWLLATGLPACQSWERTRVDFVEPFNQLLHRRYPRTIAEKDLDGLLAFYSPELAADPAFRASKKALLDRFDRVEYADDVIEELQYERRGERIEVRLFLRIRGWAADDSRISFEQYGDLVCRRFQGGYRIAEEKLEEPTVLTSREALFTEEAAARGINFRHESGGVKDRWGRIQDYAAGCGLSVGDYDDDGFDDIYLVNGTHCRLYRNQRDGTFADVTDKCGVSKTPAGEGRCGTFGDYDNDGRLDLFLGVLDAPNLLFHQNADGTFTEVGEKAGLRPTFETTGACFADFDRDGFLDLYIINGGNLLRHDPEPIHNALNAAPNVLYMNNGDGTFTDRTAEAGVGHTGWALAIAAQDYDLDGDEDIFVANDVGFSVLYRNRGDGRFDEVGWDSGIVRRGTGMGASWGDADGDGYPDLFVTGMYSNSKWIVDLPSYPSPAPWYVNLMLESKVKEIVKEMFDGNWYYRSRNDGTFQETAAACAVRNSGWAWGGTFLDYDNDGWQDVYVLNGFLSGPDPTDL